MSNTPNSPRSTYSLSNSRSQAICALQWSRMVRGSAVTLEPDGTTLLTGPVVDQAALYGLLKKVRDLGMPLVAVNRIA